MATRLTRLVELALPLASVVAFVIAWQLYVDLRNIPAIYLPSPSAIALALTEMIQDGSLAYNLGATLLRVFAGFFVAAVSGVLLGVVMGMSRQEVIVGASLSQSFAGVCFVTAITDTFGKICLGIVHGSDLHLVLKRGQRSGGGDEGLARKRGVRVGVPRQG